ncbi:hypothetical protein Smp_199020 [Schistosoma mansoni]|uniref:Secreted protein n=1 Tax=Schistosoma mansoni TaxID=6183 RepID=G4M0D3_SCHMA|nr:hypothetical protein Smp_199020 [Schistosoma mansoni]|eukprot:XP_018646950.1 hypothetical protein Smp_199020 [Schistosoma mansoni]
MPERRMLAIPNQKNGLAPHLSWHSPAEIVWCQLYPTELAASLCLCCSVQACKNNKHRANTSELRTDKRVKHPYRETCSGYERSKSLGRSFTDTFIAV